MKRVSIEQILSGDTIAILSRASEGSCALLDPHDISRTPCLLTEERPLDQAMVRRMSRLLLDDDSWWYVMKQCLPKPTALMTLGSADGWATLRIGMPCSEWRLETDAERQWGFFDPVAGQVREVLKATFPEYASAHAKSLWKAGAISALRAARSR
ncbi:hypothetical protein [Aeoliella mucimassa]|nr:hypothetical protein [Aeoliella mucimassa]